MSKTMTAVNKIDFKGIGNRDFDVTTVRRLAKLGVTIIGICAIPDMSHPMPYANAARGYQISDNGTGRIRTHAELRALAGVK